MSPLTDFDANDIAAALTDCDVPLSEREVAGILNGFGVGGRVPAGLVLQKIAELRRWMTDRWPSGVPLAEIPVESILPNGQILSGRIDLLLQLPNGWILIDHKSNPQGSDQWEKLAQRYAGQMSAYADAITRG